MPFANIIARKLRSQPQIKRFIKNMYQKIGTIVSDKKTSPNGITCISDSTYENLFGYYDKNPWNKDGSKMLYLRVSDARKKADSSDTAQIILQDLKEKEEIVIGETKSWNVQQGCMLQWLGDDNNKIIYNDFRKFKYISVIYDINSRSERIIDCPIYSVARNGKFAISLDFARLDTLRPGYGYCNMNDENKNIKVPEGACVFFVDLQGNEMRPIIDFQKLLSLSPKNTMKEAFHKVNHLMLNPSGNRFIFMHRWILNGVKYDRLLSSDINGNNIRILLDCDMVSHCNWKNDTEIIAFANYRDHGYHYYALKDSIETDCTEIPNMPDVDGHPSYSPDGRFIITDTYPSFKRKQFIYLYDISRSKLICLASVFSSGKYINETRCDLHPRWKSDSKTICFDGAQQKYRQVYTLDVKGV